MINTSTTGGPLATPSPDSTSGSTLSPQDIQQMDAITGFKSPTPTSGPTVSRSQEIESLAGTNVPQPTPEEKASADAKSLSDATSFNVNDAGRDVTGLESDFNQRGQDVIDTSKDLATGKITPWEGILQGAGSVAGSVGDMFKRGIGAISDIISSNPSVQNFANNPIVSKGLDLANGVVNATGDAVAPAIKQYDDWASANPRAAKDLGSVANIAMIGGAGVGEGAVADTTASIAKNLPDLTTDYALAEKAPAMGTDVAAQVAKSTTSGTLQDTVDAINPDLTGKAKINAYKQVVTGGRDITPPSIFGEQGLSASDQTVNIGKRLTSDIPLTDGTKIDAVNLGSNPVKNLDTLGTSLDKTEAQLDTALKGDKEVNYNAQKPELMSKLENGKTQIPREFSAIKDSKTVYNNVIDFAQEKITDAPDTIEGLRDARTAFDSQAKAEYPSAFKNGTIDTSTPAGRAIKYARDTISEHMYETAPNGSDIQKLIGREADIFRATDSVAAKAAQGEGKIAVEQMISKHPTIARYLGYGIAAAGVDKVLKTTTGIGF